MIKLIIMGAEVLEESEFDPVFSAVESSLSGKKIGLFGSYGWGDGQWMRKQGRGGSYLLPFLRIIII